MLSELIEECLDSVRNIEQLALMVPGLHAICSSVIMVSDCSNVCRIVRIEFTALIMVWTGLY